MINKILLWFGVLLLASTAFSQTTFNGNSTYRGSSTQSFQNINPGTGVFADPAGVDGNGCTQALPCTLQGATAYITAGGHGNTVIVNGSRANPYFLPAKWTFGASDSGTPAVPIIYQAACWPLCTDATMPAVSGGKQIIGTWTQDTTVPSCGTGCKWMRIDLTSTLGGIVANGTFTKFDGLFFNGVRKQRTRTTNPNTYLNLDPANPITVAAGNQTIANGPSGCNCPDRDGDGIPDKCALLQTTGIYACYNQFKFVGTDVPTGLKNLGIGDVEVLNWEKWTMSTMRLQADPIGTVAVLHGFPTITPNQGYIGGNRYLIEGTDPHDAHTFQAPDQWYLDRCPITPSCTSADATWTLYYSQAAGEDINNTTVIVPQLATVLQIDQAHDITFRGISFKHDNWVPGPWGVDEQQGQPKVTAAIEITDSQNVLFDSCIVSKTMGWGIEWQRVQTNATNSNVSFINGMMYDIGGGPWKVGHGILNDSGDSDSNVPQNWHFDNNRASHAGQRDPSGEGLVWTGNTHHWTMDHNELDHFIGGGGIGVGFMNGRSLHARSFCHDWSITNNFIHDIMEGDGTDMGGIYSACNLSDFAPTGTNGAFANQAPTLVPFTYTGKIEGNKIGDIATDLTIIDPQSSSLSAHCFYGDQGTSTVYFHNNQCYRTSGSSIFNNLSDRATADTYFTYNLYDNNVLASCGANASIVHNCLQRGGHNGNSLTYSHNVTTWYTGNFHMQNPGSWGCFADDGVTIVPCSQRFNLFGNIYYRNGSGATPSFIQCLPSAGDTNCGKATGSGGQYKTSVGVTAWQTDSGLDANSTSTVNPAFANQAAGDYTPTFVSSNWTPVSWAAVGPTAANTFTIPTNLPNMYPLFPLLPSAYETTGGGAPAVTLSPTSLTFPATNLGASVALPVTVTNSGTATLTVSAVTITGTNAGDYSQTNNCSSVAAGANCVITATFMPTANGSRTATLNIADDAAGSPQTVAMTGTGQTQTQSNLENLYCTASDVVTGLVAEGPAQPIQTCMYTALAHTPSGAAATPPGAVTHLAAGGNLQTTLNAAACGDTILLDPTGTWTGIFTFPRKNCDQDSWIYIKADTADANLPPEGTRITPCYAGVASLPGRPAYPCPNATRVIPKLKLVAQNDTETLSGDHYRLIGLEISAEPSTSIVYTGITENGGDHLIVDRCWIHGDATNEFSSAIGLNGASRTAIINSYISDAKCKAPGVCSEGHGITGATSSTNDATIKVVNNFIEASGEGFIFGGGPATTTPHDIEVRRNYFFKPLTWDPADPSFFGTTFTVKNHWECKNCDGVLLEGNILQNTWGGFSQVGAAFLFTPKNQAPGSQCPICYDSNFIVRYNHVINAAQWMQMANAVGSGGFPAAGGGNYSIHDILAEGLSYKNCYKCGNYQSQLSDLITAPANFVLKNVLIDHITAVSALDNPGVQGGFLTLGGQVGMPSITWKNSIMDAGWYGPWSTGQGTSDCATIAISPNGPLQKFDSCFAAPYVFQGNVIARGAVVHQGGSNPQWPTGNFFPAAQANIGYTDLTNGDYHLAAGTAYKGMALDGKDPGADIDLVNQYTNGVDTGIGGIIVQTQSPAANNTSGCTTQAYCTAPFPGISTDAGHIGAQTVVIDRVPTHVSTESPRANLYNGATTRVLAHVQPWWGCAGLGHITSVGYSEQNTATIDAIIKAMIQFGINGIDIDYYGNTGAHSCEKTTVDTVKAYLSANNPLALDGSRFTMTLALDKGAISPICDPSEPNWAIGTTYALGASVFNVADGKGYVSLVGSNLGNHPESQPTKWQLMDTCLINAINGQNDFIRDNYAEPGGAVPLWYETTGGFPLTHYFIIQTNWAGTNWATIYTATHAHTSAYSHPFKTLDQNSGGLTETAMDGGYAWVRGMAWDINNQLCWQNTGGCGDSFLYLRNFYATCKANPTRICMGSIWKGFDDSVANWGVAPFRVTAQRCGQTILDSTAEVALAPYSSSAQLQYLLYDTWNDYEEGTEVETGVDNCLSLTASMGGTTVTWVPAFSDATWGTLNTVGYFNVYSQVGSGPMTLEATRIANTATSLDLASYIPISSPTVTYKIFVEAVGKSWPIANQGNWTQTVTLTR